MRIPKPRVILISVALVAIGSIAGALLDRMSFPHVARLFNTCASSKQFLVEFRRQNWYWQEYSATRISTVVGEVTLDVDGIPIGTLGEQALRYFLCEGNHQAHVLYKDDEGKTVAHTVALAVSRPSLFLISEQMGTESEIAKCDSVRECYETVYFQFSPYEPDDPKVRVYPREEGR